MPISIVPARDSHLPPIKRKHKPKYGGQKNPKLWGHDKPPKKRKKTTKTGYGDKLVSKQYGGKIQ